MSKGVQINIKGEQEGQDSPPSPGGLGYPLLLTAGKSLLFGVSDVWGKNRGNYKAYPF